MPFPKGTRHSDEARAKMSAARIGVPKTAAHKLKISEANRGRVHEPKHERVCPCGAQFRAANPTAVFCSVRCKRAAHGHGRIHAPEFAHFPRVCAICGVASTLVGDHRHSDGAPRGVLCRNHNVGLGYFADDPALLRAAAAYLEGGPCAST